MVLVGVMLSLPSESWLSRIVRSIVGLVTWLCLFAMLREWLLRRRARKEEGTHEA
jgi:putative effector of murein hydrolase LrgA (UPF0299 family)